jgi:hypothetical protein
MAQPTTPTADGTWRDDGRYIIINIDGREMKLLKSTSESMQTRQAQPTLPERPEFELPTPLPAVPPGSDVYRLPPTGPETIGVGPVLGDAPPSSMATETGTVHGRLLQKGYPVTNCHVVIVPWPKGKSDESLDTRMPLTTTTDDGGCYCFEHVPPGEYKLTWLPAGSRSWIRRIAMRPDVIVHEGQDLELKDVRMALQTIN